MDYKSWAGNDLSCAWESGMGGVFELLWLLASLASEEDMCTVRHNCDEMMPCTERQTKVQLRRGYVFL